MKMGHTTTWTRKVCKFLKITITISHSSFLEVTGRSRSRLLIVILPTKRARASARQYAVNGNILERDLHDFVYRPPARGRPAIFMVFDYINNTVNGVTLPIEHHLTHLERLHNVHDPSWNAFGIPVEDFSHHTKRPTAIKPRLFSNLLSFDIRRKPRQPVSAVPQRLHQRIAVPRLLGLSITEQCTRRVLVVLAFSGSHFRDGVHGEAEYGGDPDSFERVTWDAIWVQRGVIRFGGLVRGWWSTISPL